MNVVKPKFAKNLFSCDRHRHTILHRPTKDKEVTQRENCRVENCPMGDADRLASFLSYKKEEAAKPKRT